MKKFLLFFLVGVFFINTASSQRRTQTVKWFSLAAKTGIGNSVLLNVDIIEDGNVDLNYFSMSQSFGGRFTFTIGDNIGFGADLLFSKYNQKYTIINTNEVYDKDLAMKTLDILPFFRYTGNTGVYIEVGPKLSTIKSIEETNTTTSAIVRPNLIGNYEPKFTSIVLGFGAGLYSNERLDVNLGARLSYSFTDITPNAAYNVTGDGYYFPNYAKSYPTNPASVQIILEVNYFFAFWGDASCGRGRFMLFK
ncbi:MAG: PorT family protein [Bacteroidales bacterium]|nr:PorT family protein [Bacteroidales bacterium]